MNDDFQNTYVSFAMVIKLPWRELEGLKNAVSDYPGDVRVIYQKTDPGNLYIVKEKPEPLKPQNLTSK